MARRHEPESSGGESWPSLVELGPTTSLDARLGVRVMIYDRTSWWRHGRPDLTPLWAMGGLLYRALRRIDVRKGVSSWDEALQFLAEVRPERPIEEVQFWGHGLWGLAMIGNDRLDERSLAADHRLAPRLDAVRGRMLQDGGATWWFRTCQTFGANRGRGFANALADRLACRAAGHTFIIGHWQSGLHSVRPGCTAAWDPDEGIAEGNAQHPERAHWSGRRKPNTITFLHGKIPAGY